MGRQFDSNDDIVKRLHGTVCIYAGHPVYVMFSSEFKDLKHVNYIPVEEYNRYGNQSKMKWTKVDYTQDTFRYKAFPLGYVNHNGYAYYLSRIPNRYQYYGLSPDSIHWEPRPSDHYGIVFSSGFVDMINRRYPSLDDAETQLIAGHKSFAISTDVAIERIKGRTLQLLFKGKPVGIKMTGDRFTLFDIPEAKFLRKILGRAGVIS